MCKWWIGTLLVACLMVVGCEPKADTPPAKKQDKESVKADEDNKHSGWWCEEHGIPESECSMCSSRVAKECKAKGDWCDKHDRAKSQCFICDPTLMAKFAAKYEAKYGKQPPEPTDNMPEKKAVDKEPAKDAKK